MNLLSLNTANYIQNYHYQRKKREKCPALCHSPPRASDLTPGKSQLIRDFSGCKSSANPWNPIPKKQNWKQTPKILSINTSIYSCLKLFMFSLYSFELYIFCSFYFWVFLIAVRKVMGTRFWWRNTAMALPRGIY